jgi:hypothetical protein
LLRRGLASAGKNWNDFIAHTSGSTWTSSVISRPIFPSERATKNASSAGAAAAEESATRIQVESEITTAFLRRTVVFLVGRPGRKHMRG